MIYVIRDPRTGCIRYVGQTNALGNRITEHAYGNWGRVPQLRTWINFLRYDRLKPIYEVVERTTFEKAFEREGWWIRTGRLLSWPLLNKNHRIWEQFGVEQKTSKSASEIPPRQIYRRLAA